MTAAPAMPARTALVVFVGHAQCRWLRGLKRGFRHCFVAVRDDPDWLICDPLKDRVEISVVRLPAEFDLAAFYVARGHLVMVGQTDPAPTRRPFVPALLTCVTVAKRVLGMRAPWIVTPWQLWRHLCRQTGTWRPVDGPRPAEARASRPTTEVHIRSMPQQVEQSLTRDRDESATAARDHHPTRSRLTIEQNRNIF